MDKGKEGSRDVEIVIELLCFRAYREEESATPRSIARSLCAGIEVDCCSGLRDLLHAEFREVQALDK